METDILKTVLPLSWGRNSLASLSYTFDLPTLIENLKKSHAWLKGELNSLILLNNPEKQILLTALHEGMEINSFQSKDSITIQIIEGRLEFHTRNETVTLFEEQSFRFDENVNFSLTTNEETMFLLIMETSIIKNQNGSRRGGYKN